MIRQALRWTMLGVVAAALSLAAGESAYRLLRTGKLGPTTNPRYVVHDEQLGWSYLPGASDRHRAAEFDVAVDFNARGFRDAEWTLDRGDQPLLLVLGDSFAFGWGVERDEGISGLLAAGLPDWRVRGAAVSGYGTDQQLLLLQRLVETEKPAAVALVFCPNDLDEVALGFAYGHRKPWFEWDDGKLVLRGVPVEQPWIERYSHLAGALDKVWHDRLAGERPRASGDRWELVQALLGQMQGLIDPAPLLLVSGTDELAAFAQDPQNPSVEHFDQRTVLESLGQAGFFEEDGHWTAAGHRAVADGLIPLVQRLR